MQSEALCEACGSELQCWSLTRLCQAPSSEDPDFEDVIAVCSKCAAREALAHHQTGRRFVNIVEVTHRPVDSD